MDNPNQQSNWKTPKSYQGETLSPDFAGNNLGLLMLIF